MKLTGTAITKLKVADVKVHELAHLTPKMTEVEYTALLESITVNGQQVPVVLFEGQIIDGRHRLKALQELEAKEILCVKLTDKCQKDDAIAYALEISEMRRHQTPTQKAIMGYYAYMRMVTNGVKCSQAAIAKTFGTSRMSISRVKRLYVASGNSKELIDHLYNGKKINIGANGSALLGSFIVN